MKIDNFAHEFLSDLSDKLSKFRMKPQDISTKVET